MILVKLERKMHVGYSLK